MIIRSGVSRGSCFRRSYLPLTPNPLLPRRLRVGDSQTAGRETETTARNHWVIFDAIWLASGFAVPTQIDTNSQNGFSGRSLSGTLTHTLTRPFVSSPWIHLQESGNQNNDGQRTALEFGATFEAGMISLNTMWPGCLLSYETAHSFSPARKAEQWRNWDTYNVELLVRISALALLGINVILVDTARYIDLAIAALGYDTVCFPDGHADAYHYQGIGNFVIAMIMFKAFGYDVTTLNHSDININVSHKSTAVNLVASN